MIFNICFRYLNKRFSKISYAFHEKFIIDSFQSIIIDVCNSLKSISYSTHGLDELNEDENVKVAMKLFEVFLTLKQFSTFRSMLCISSKTLQITKYYEWFMNGLNVWIKIYICRVTLYISKAIEIDNFIPIDDHVNHSSSAVDVMTKFYQIKIFWQQINWPDYESSYAFMSRIIYDILTCFETYTASVIKCVKYEKDLQNNQLISACCVVINNIEYLMENLPKLVNDFNLNGVILGFAKNRSDVEIQRCSEAINDQVESSIEYTNCCIVDVIEFMAKQFFFPFIQLLTDCAEDSHENEKSLTSLLNYLEDIFEICEKKLLEQTFDKLFRMISNRVFDLINKIVHESISVSVYRVHKLIK